MLDVVGLTYFADNHFTVQKLSFALEAGEVGSMIGPNLAGKTLSLRLISGATEPDSGAARISGADIVADPRTARSKLGWVPAADPLPPGRLIQDFINSQAKYHRLRGSERDEAVFRAAKRCGVHELLDCAIGAVTAGQRRRAQIAAAIVHDPDVIILDEPTRGLDEGETHFVRDLLKALAAQGKTVLFSTRSCEEVEDVSHRTIILHHGKQMACGKPKELAKRHPSGRLSELYAELTSGRIQ